MKISRASSVVLALVLCGCTAMGAGEPAGTIVSENFESTAPGAIPAGYTKTGNVEVEQGVAHSGTHALRMNPAVRGGRYINLPADKVAALGGAHWGRLYIKLKTPTPMPTGNLIHATIVDGHAVSPLAHDVTDVRMATWLFYPTGEFKYIYNVQPPNGRREFGPQSKNMLRFDDAWHLLEWHVDAASQTYQFFLDGKEVTDIGQSKGAGNYTGIEIPDSFQTMSVGFTNYQAATGEGFTVWIDDVAFGKNRLGPVPGAAR
jgi:hypothetical protein